MCSSFGRMPAYYRQHRSQPTLHKRCSCLNQIINAFALGLFHRASLLLSCVTFTRFNGCCRGVFEIRNNNTTYTYRRWRMWRLERLARSQIDKWLSKVFLCFIIVVIIDGINSKEQNDNVPLLLSIFCLRLCFCAWCVRIRMFSYNLFCYSFDGTHAKLIADHAHYWFRCKRALCFMLMRLLLLLVWLLDVSGSNSFVTILVPYGPYVIISFNRLSERLVPNAFYSFPNIGNKSKMAHYVNDNTNNSNRMIQKCARIMVGAGWSQAWHRHHNHLISIWNRPRAFATDTAYAVICSMTPYWPN